MMLLPCLLAVSPAGSSESESSGVSLWLIVSVVLGALLIVAIAVVLVVCYKRQKARNNEGQLNMNMKRRLGLSCLFL